MRRRRRTHPAEAVRARRGHRHARPPDQLPRHRMRRHSHSHQRPSRSHRVRNRSRPRQQQRQRPRPERLHQPRNHAPLVSRRNRSHALQHLAPFHMHNHRGPTRPSASPQRSSPPPPRSSAFAPSPYTVSVGNATVPPARSNAAARATSLFSPAAARSAGPTPAPSGPRLRVPAPTYRSSKASPHSLILPPAPYTQPMQTAEIELKFPIHDLAGLQSRLPGLGFQLDTPRTFEQNTLYDTPSRTLRASRQILAHSPLRRPLDRHPQAPGRRPRSRRPGRLQRRGLFRSCVQLQSPHRDRDPPH